MIWNRRRRRNPAPASHPAGVRPAPDQVTPIARQLGNRVLLLAWTAAAHLTEAQRHEQDPGQLERLFRTDHALTRIRRAAEALHVLTGSQVNDPDRQTTSILDVIRAAASAVEHYPRVNIGHTVDLAVTDVAADDVIRILTELIDNAARFSAPGTPVTVSAYLTDTGAVLVRVEDNGIGVDGPHLPKLNAILTGAAPPDLDDQQATRLGLLVVAALIRAQPHLQVQLSPRRPAGTTAMLLVNAELICEIPAATAPDAKPVPQPAASGAGHRSRPPTAVSPAASGTTPITPDPTAMPRRQSASVRGTPTKPHVETPSTAPTGPLAGWDAGAFDDGVDDARQPTSALQGRHP